ncbi:MAG: PQQ-binding-like beta-propeller repeat protein [Deltaproteobacteria bacterium]|nr:PQQ-binding-like beta-propeller repeat protein [Deltaproteobacteria bacterium]
MLKRYYKEHYKKFQVSSFKFQAKSCILHLTSCILIGLLFTGCAGEQIVRKEIKTFPWETYLSNKERQGRTGDKLVAPPVLSTSYMVADAAMFKFFIPYEPTEYSSPAIVDNIIYIGSTDKHFYAIDLITGKKIWGISTTGAVESSPTLADGRVYFGTGDGILYCLDSKDGREIWRFQVKTEITSSPVVDGGVVYFNSADDKVYALKAETGEKLWQYSRTYVKKVVKRMFASPALYEDKIYCNFTDGYLVAMEKSSGREVWQKKVMGEGIADTARFTPTIDSGAVYVINGDGVFIVLDAKNGEEKWRFDIIKISDFTINNSYIVIAGYDGSIIAMNKLIGEIIWKKRVSQGIPVSIIAVDEYLAVASNYKTETFFSNTIGSYVDIFDMVEGGKMWSENIDSTTSASLAAAYNHLFWVTDKGYLRIYKSVNIYQ